MNGAALSEPRRRRVPGLRDPVEILLSAAVLTSAVYLLVLDRHLSFLFDDWQFLIDRPGWSAHSLLDPHNEHIVVLPVAIYKVLLATVGMDSAFPFRVVSTLVFLSSAVLLFVYLRERVNDWLALAGSVLILFLGAGYEDLLWSFQIGFFGSMAAGLGMLLALERRRDGLACLLLVVSTGFSSLGLSFAAGALIEIGTSRDRWRRAYVAAIPLLLYAIWWLVWGHTADNALSWANFTEMPQYVADAFAAGLASLLGLSPLVPIGLPGSPDVTLQPLEWGRPLLVAAVSLAAWRIYKLGRIPRWLWIVAVIGFSFWVLAALNEKPGRTAIASRYQYVSAVFILLIAAELLRGVRIRRSGWLLLSGATALIALSGIGLLHQGYKSYRTTSEIGRADLSALEIARGQVKQSFSLDPSFSGTTILVNAGRYFDRVDDFGSPAYTSAELSSAPEPAREAADRVLAAGLGLHLAPHPALPASGREAPVLVGPDEALLGSSGSCLAVQATELDAPLLELPAGGVTLKAGRASQAEVRLRRFAGTALPVDLGSVSSGEIEEISIPADRSSETWKLSLQGDGRVIVCGLPA
jgi:hypothetical protein